MPSAPSSFAAVVPTPVSTETSSAASCPMRRPSPADEAGRVTR